MSPSHARTAATHAPPSPKALREYAFVADGYRGALLGPDGDVAWMCFPGWSDTALFAGLLGSGGTFRVTPSGPSVAGGYYEGASLIWRSRFVTHHGTFESRDALVYPGSPNRAVFLRQLQACDTIGDFLVEFAPATDYGRSPLRSWRRSGEVFVARSGDVTVRLQVPASAEVVPLRPHGGGLALRVKVIPGERYDFVAEFVSGDVPGTLPGPDECWRSTAAAWRLAVPDCSGLLAGPDVARSVAVLRGMTDHHGGTIAAATTSLPERDGGDRNYDYRFCWVRDTCFVGQAGAALPGGEELLDDAVRWVTERLRADKERTAPAYLGNGEPIYPPAHLDVAGYPGGTDVVGNGVGGQFQLDIFGEALLLFARATGRDRLDADAWQAATIALGAIEQRWEEPDGGIWELEPRHWAHSRLICVAGLRAMAVAGGRPEWSARALTLSDQILARTNATSLHSSGHWQRSPGDDRLDASLLLAEVRGALSPADPRSEITRSAVARALGKDHYLYRYCEPGHELGEDEGAFLIGNFWMSLAQLGSGSPTEAAHWFERGRAAMSTAGLFSEEFDAVEHQLRGNLPQAFVHAMFIEAASAHEPA